MKKTTKLLVLALTAVIFLISATPAFAYSDEQSIDSAHDTDEEIEATENDNALFESLLSAFEENASEIFSILAFIGSLIIMLSYKKGLLPIITDGLKALKSGIKTVNDKSELFNEHAIGICDSIDARLERAEKITEAVLKSAETVEEDIAEIKKTSTENEKLKVILTAQIDMLYEIFMSASLPQYLKDNVGEKIAQMKSALAKEVEENANA